MTKIKKEKKVYTLFTGKQLLWLILPIVIEQIFSTSLGLFDSMMVSGIDDYGNAGNAVTNVDQLNNLVIQLFSAFATGGAIVTSQFIGAQKYDDAAKSAKHVLVIVATASLLISAVCLVFNAQILNLFYGNIEGAVVTFQRQYFYITAASFPFIGMFNASAALLRTQRKSLVTMASAAMSCVLNVGMNAIFIYVLNMGVLGAALATLICRAIPAMFMLCLLFRKTNIVPLKLFEKFCFDGGMVKHILKIAIPSGVESALFQLGKLMTFRFVNNSTCYNVAVEGMFDSNGEQIYKNIQANGNSIATNINNIASVVGSGVGTSCLTVIGQAVGAGDIDQCKYYMKKMFLISYLANAICVGLIMCSAHWLVRLYDYPEEAYGIALKCLYFCLSFQFVTYPLSFTTPAILKATSDVKYVMICAITSMIVVRVGLCYFMTTDNIFGYYIDGLPKLGAFGFWIGMCSDWVMRGVLFMSRLLSGRWKKSSGLFKEPAAATALPVEQGVETSPEEKEVLPVEGAEILPAEAEREKGEDENKGV